MGAVCAGTAPTGSKGEALTFTRASSATCTKTATGGGIATGIAVGDLTTVTSDQPRVEYDFAGVLGILKEAAGTNDGLRSEELDNVAWTSTAAVTANAATPPNNTSQISNAEQLSDVSAAAFQGSCQTIVTTSATTHTFYAHVRAGTATTAQITMVGTGSSTGDCSATVTGLSGTTWDILSCTSPAAYAGTLTAITVCVNVGNTVAITGTIMAWGADHKVASVGRTSYVPTTAAAATRATEGVPTWAITIGAGSGASAATSIATTYTPTTMTTLALPAASGNPELLGRFATGFGCYMRTPGTDLAAGTWVTGSNRWACSSGRFSGLNGVTATGASTTFTGATTTVGIGSSGGFGDAVDGIYSRICVDPDPSRCR